MVLQQVNLLGTCHVTLVFAAILEKKDVPIFRVLKFTEMDDLSVVERSKLLDIDYNCVVIKLKPEDKVKKDCKALQEHGLKIMEASGTLIILTVKTMSINRVFYTKLQVASRRCHCLSLVRFCDKK